MVTTTRWDITEHLDSEESIAAYLSVVLQEGDASEIRDAIGHVARARGMTELAKKTGVTRVGLYKALSENGNPSFALIHSLVKALGIQLLATAQPVT